MLQDRKTSELATQDRDRALGKAKGQNTKTRGTALYLITSIRDILMGLYRGNERKLGEWGYTVQDSVTSDNSDKPTDNPAEPPK